MSNGCNLPPGWREVRLEDACTVIVSPVDKKSVKGEIPVKLCNYTDVYYNYKIDSSINFMAATAKPREIDKFSVLRGDVIITKDSETPNDIGVPAYVTETIEGLLCGYHLAILRPKNGTVGKYISYALTTHKVNHDFYRFANGITRFGLTSESYRGIKIPLPPFHEQKIIADILQTWDTAIEKTEALIAAKEKQLRWLKYKIFSGVIENSGHMKNNLCDICEIETGNKDVNEGNPNGRYPFFTCAREHTYSDSYSFDMEAILLAGNGYIGNPILHRGKFEAYQRTYVLHSFKNVDTEYLKYFLGRDAIQKKFSQEGQKGVMSYIRLKTLQTVRIILPPLHEQKMIAYKFNMAKREIDILGELRNCYRVQKHGLMQKLLTGQWKV